MYGYSIWLCVYLLSVHHAAQVPRHSSKEAQLRVLPLRQAAAGVVVVLVASSALADAAHLDTLPADGQLGRERTLGEPHEARVRARIEAEVVADEDEALELPSVDERERMRGCGSEGEGEREDERMRMKGRG